jgi:hypothetical protein
MTRGRTATLVSWLKLGRVSNLPTVWSNTLAAIALSGGEWTMGLAAASAVSMSLFYVAGMILNDVFDAEYDGIHRPTRPIPSGQVGRAVAAATGFSGLGLATMVVVALAFSRGVHASGALTWTLLLAATIVGYDVYHKTNPLSPVVMGGCRALVLLCVSWTAVGTIAAPVLIAAGLQWAYVVGLTYAAKQEDLARPGSFWPVFLVFLAPIVVGSAWLGVGEGRLVAPGSSALLGLTMGVFVVSTVIGIGPLLSEPKRIGLAVGRLIAGIAVLDALMIAATVNWGVGVATALGCALLTRLGQRYVPGT